MTNILINNGKLGRQGKTTLAYTLYKHSDKDYQYITNDIDNASIDLEGYVDGEDLLIFPQEKEIDVNPDRNAIFDFGGEPDERLLKVATYVDLILVPISYESDSELEITIQNINALQEVNDNLVVVINKTDTEDVALVKKVFKVTFPKIPIFVINKSRFIRRLSNDSQTVYEVAAASKRDAGLLKKTILPQFDTLFDYLETNY